MDLSMRLQKIRSQIQLALKQAQRPADAVRLIGVSKRQNLPTIVEALREDLWDLGENYTQEWKLKRQGLEAHYPHLAAQVRWHFIGQLQKNKIKELVGRADYIHSVDDMEAVRRIDLRAQSLGITQKILIEINFGGESHKGGMSEKQFLENLGSFSHFSHLSLEGLMTVPPQAPPEQTRAFFERLKSLLDEANQSGLLKNPLQELSMGMSQDFELAIATGATMIRVGTALFGARI